MDTKDKTHPLEGRYIKCIDDSKIEHYPCHKGNYLKFVGEVSRQQYWGAYTEDLKDDQTANPRYWGSEAEIKEYFELMPKGFKPETILERWIEETKKKNLSLVELKKYIRSSLTCPNIIYTKLPGLDTQDKTEILFNEWNTQPKPIEKWSVGSYVVCIEDYSTRFHVGDIGQIENGAYSMIEDCVIISKSIGKACMPFKSSCRWFATKSEAEEFARSLNTASVKENEFPTEGRCTFDERVEDFLKKDHSIYESSKALKINTVKFICWNSEKYWYVTGATSKKEYHLSDLEVWLDKCKQPLKQAVHCKTQEEWDFVLSKLPSNCALSKQSNDFKEFIKDNSSGIAIDVSDCSWCDIDYWKENNYQILSFQEWCDLNGYKMEEKLIQEIGVWYKWVYHTSCKDGLKYVKSKRFSESQLFYSERIDVDGTYKEQTSDCSWDDEMVKIDLSEIQEFLPDGHPDKVKNKFTVGTWYKLDNWISKFHHLEEDYRFYGENINTYSGYLDPSGWLSLSDYTPIALSIEEVQQYLPDGHPDKKFVLPDKWCIKVTPENKSVLEKWRTVVCLSATSGYCLNKHVLFPGVIGYWVEKKPENYTEITMEQFNSLIKSEKPIKQAVNCETQEQWDFVTEKLGYKWEAGRWDDYKADSKISLNYQEYGKSYECYYSFQEWCNLNDFKMSKTERDWSRASIEEILEEAKRRYPIGTKFIPAHASQNPDYFCIVCTTDFRYGGGYLYAVLPDNTVDDIQNNPEYGNCSLNRVIFYSKEWATILPTENKPQFEVGKWYQIKTAYNWIIKYKGTNNGKIESDWSCLAKPGNKVEKGGNWGSKPTEVEELSIEEIQQYLPDNHPDKLPSKLAGILLNESHIGELISLTYNGKYYKEVLVTREQEHLYLLNNVTPNNDSHSNNVKYAHSLMFQNFAEVNKFCTGIKLIGIPTPIIDQKFKVGDWIVLGGRYSHGGYAVGDLFQVESLQTNTFSVRSKNSKDIASGFSYTLNRLATAKEVNDHLFSTKLIIGDSVGKYIMGIDAYGTCKSNLLLSIDDEELPMVSIIKTNTIKQLLNND